MTFSHVFGNPGSYRREFEIPRLFSQSMQFDRYGTPVVRPHPNIGQIGLIDGRSRVACSVQHVIYNTPRYEKRGFEYASPVSNIQIAMQLGNDRLYSWINRNLPEHGGVVINTTKNGRMVSVDYVTVGGRTENKYRCW